MKYLKTFEKFQINESSSNKVNFYSKLTDNLLIEIEKIGNSFVYWTYEPSSEDKELYDELGYDGTDEIGYEEGYKMISELMDNNKLYFDGFIKEHQTLDPDYFEGGSETMFKETELKSIDDVIETFMKEGIYVFKLDDDRLFQLTDYLKGNNIEYGETSQLGSDITIYDPKKHPRFAR